MNKLNQPMIIDYKKGFENIPRGQRIMVPEANCTGRYIRENEVLYKKEGELRKKKLLNLIISDVDIGKNNPDYGYYHQIWEELN